MFRRLLTISAMVALLALAVACTNKKVQNPLANVGSKQPDKVLFDRAMDAMKHNKFDVARLSLQTLINTYPDSEFVARAKLAVGDSWYAEGGTAALQQAEIEYKDFITFFPNMPEAAEAQMKIANIHFQQMEKPDRDFTHALRAQDEYRQLILQYPDSEFVARAKLAVGDSWYAEGGTAALQQAEIEYKDFITFFPNMPEASEAQMKIANIHFQQMEKPDRDFTHALRAQDEYRQLILQYPDSKLVPVAKERLREVQEVLAEREFRIGRFYYLRESYPAAIARLQNVAQSYPLYSRADENLFMLGQCYEGEINAIRMGRLNETAKGKLIADFTRDAAKAYDEIITRYPIMDRAEDAKRRLEALRQPVPTPTPQAIAQNKAEEASRRETGMFGRVMNNFTRHPEMAEAARVGEPTLVDPKPTSATQVAQEAVRALATSNVGGQGSGTVSVEQVKPGATPPPSQPIPRSDNPDTSASPATGNNAGAAGTNGGAADNTAASPTPAGNAATPASTDSNNGGIEDLTSSTSGNTQNGQTTGTATQPAGTATPAATAQPAKSNDGLTAPAQAPAQINDAANSTDGSAQQANPQNAQNSSDQGSSSSNKKKKKKHKLVPF